MKHPSIIALAILFSLFSQLYAQTISGTVNTYASVSAIAGANVTVGAVGGFNVGDRVLLIQMKGATISTANTANYGDVTALNNAGNYEFNCIQAIAGNVITLSSPPTNAYTPSGLVQLIRVPVYNNPTVNATLTAAPWNGTTGGVIVLETTGRLTLNANIDASGQGFRGGAFQSGGFNCTASNYSAPLGQGGTKGEGITALIAGQETQRGKLANGGGGATPGNAGAGGGSNAAAGGLGGRVYSGCGASTIQGVGGAALAAIPTKIFAGGGGGGGFRDNGQPTTNGANGGGIIILVADTIVGNSNSILANGNSVTTNTNDEGAGAGGGGGSIYVVTDTFIGPITVRTNGGNGGNTFNNIFTSQCHGPGGGGGGGLFWVSLPAVPPVVTFTATGGNCGIVANPVSSCFNTTFQGTNGTNGLSNINLAILSAGSATVDLGLDSSICAGTALVLDAGPGFSNYLWSDGSTLQTLSVAVADTYFVEATGTCGIAFDTVIVTLDTLPIINLGPDTAVCLGDTFTFDAGAGYPGYLWHSGSTLQTFESDTAGQFFVAVTNGEGCVGRDTVNLTIHPLPAVNLGNDTLICQGRTITFNAGAGFAGYLWQDGSTNATLTTGTAGAYHVTVTDANGCTNADTINLTVAPNPVTNLGPNQSICQGATVLLNAGAGFSSYLWQNGANSQTFQVTTTGTYHVLVTDANGCQDRDTAQVTVNPNPVISLGNDTLLCPGETLVLDPGPGFTSYLWNNGQATQTRTVSASGQYWVLVTDANGCTDRDTINVSVGNVTVNLGPDVEICAGEVVRLDPGPGYSSIVWQDGSVGRPYFANTAGTYSVVVTGAGGCTATDTMRILAVHPLPVISLGPDSVICMGQTLVLTPGPGYAAYQWQDGSSNATYNATLVGLYHVTVTDNFGCQGRDTMRIPDRVPVPNVNLGNDLTFCMGDSAILSANPLGPWGYVWSTGETTQTIVVRAEGTYFVTVSNRCGTDTDNQTVLPLRLPPVAEIGPDTFFCENPILIDAGSQPNGQFLWHDGSTNRWFTANRVETVWVRITNVCGEDSDTLVVADGCPPELYFPNAFSPNGDNLNDRFYPVGQLVQEFEMEIYDRWGKLIFISTEQNGGWDGQYGGIPVPEGVYVWKARWNRQNLGQMESLSQTGSVTVIR